MAPWHPVGKGSVKLLAIEGNLPTKLLRNCVPELHHYSFNFRSYCTCVALHIYYLSFCRFDVLPDAIDCLKAGLPAHQNYLEANTSEAVHL